MKFSVEKCKVTHLGRHNENLDYYINAQMLQKTKADRNLRIVTTDNINVGKVLANVRKLTSKQIEC